MVPVLDIELPSFKLYGREWERAWKETFSSPEPKFFLAGGAFAPFRRGVRKTLSSGDENGEKS